MSTSRRRKKKVSEAMAFLEEVNGGPLTFGQMLSSLRKCEGMSQAELARRLDISTQKLCDVEKGRRFIGVDRAVQWANMLGQSEFLFVSVLVEDQLRKHGIEARVVVETAQEAPEAA